jgi:tetratricopeptide (TPR) repeat protein
MLLKFIAKGVFNAVGGGISGDLLFEVVPDVAADVWKWWSSDRNANQRRADLAAVAVATPAEVRASVTAIVHDIALELTADARQNLDIYLSLVPGQVRKSLRRPADPTGTTITPALCPARADDLVTILPTRLPRFKAGDHPLSGVDWELDELLGVGGFGEVWRAHNPHLSSVPPVALKFCLDPATARFLRNEAAVLDRVMRQGRHPGIVTLQHTYLSAETPCLEYELVVGGDLAGLIQEWHRGTPKPGPVDICRPFRQLAEVVAFAHAQSPPIVHRDLKPANVLLQKDEGGRIKDVKSKSASDSSFILHPSSFHFKIADFGIGGLATRQAITQQTRGTSRGTFLVSALRGSCTPLYASPQQMRGEAPDPRDDVYALGVIWYQMLIGDLTAGRPGGTRWHRRLVELGMPAEMVELLGECFEDSPADRIADAGLLSRRLEALLPGDVATPANGGRPIAVTVEPTPPRQSPPARATAPPASNGELERSLGECDEAIRRRPSDALAWSKRGEVCRLLGKQEQAIRDCTEAIRLDTRLDAAYATRGSAYRMMGRLDLAVADCSQAISLDPRNVLAWYNRGEAYRLQGELERSIADCSEALRLDPGYSWAYGTRAASLRQKGELSRAIADLDENIRLDPGYAWAWAVRGEAYRLKADYERAITDCSEALRLQPNYSLAYATRGAAFRQKGDFATAEADLMEALRLRSDYQWARDQLEMARRRQR